VTINRDKTSKVLSYVNENGVKYICSCKGSRTSQRLYWRDDVKEFVTGDGKHSEFLNPRITLEKVSRCIEAGLKDLIKNDLKTLKQNISNDGCVLRIVKQFTIFAQKTGFENVVLVCSNKFGTRENQIKRFDWIKTFDSKGLRL
jgi:hypothetical protein